MEYLNQSNTFHSITAKSTTGTSIYAGSDASDNGSDWCGIWVDQVCTPVDRYSIGVGCVNVFAPSATITAAQAIQTANDAWGWVGLNTAASHATQTFHEHNAGSYQVSVFADAGKTVNVDLMRAIKITTPTIVTPGTINIVQNYGIDIEHQGGISTAFGAMRIANNNPIWSRNFAGDGLIHLMSVDASNNAIIGDGSYNTVFYGAAILLASPVYTSAVRFHLAQGAAVSSANNLVLGTGGNYFNITGTTQINLLSSAGWQGGSQVTLKFDAAVTVKHNQSVSGDNKPIILAGGADFIARVGDLLQLIYDSTGAVWRDLRTGSRMGPKSLTVEAPTNTENISMFFAEQPWTLKEIRSVLRGSSTPSVTFSIRYGTDRSAAGTEIVTSGITVTSTTTGVATTSFTNGTIPAGNFVWLTTSAQSGTVNELSVTLN